MSNTIVVKDKGCYRLCRLAIGGEHYYPVVTLFSKEEAEKLVEKNEKRCIVELSSTRFVITKPGAGIKEIWAEAVNFVNARQSLEIINEI